MAFLQRRIDRASVERFLAALLLLAVYAWWNFTADSPWTRALEAAGSTLPELIVGFPATEPAETLQRLGAARADYAWAQIFDLPFVALSALVASSAMAIGMRRLSLSHSDAQFLLLVPAMYVAFELIENMSLALFASGAIEPSRGRALLQQIFTMTKLSSGLLAIVFGAAGVFVWIAAEISRFSKSWT